MEIIFGQGTSATDIEGQIALIESMVSKGVQGIAITPVDPTVATTLDKAVAKGVKVVLMDNKIPDWKGQTALATTNNLEAGKIAGAYLKTVDVFAVSPFPLVAIGDLETMDLDGAAIAHRYARPPLKGFGVRRGPSSSPTHV